MIRQIDCTTTTATCERGHCVDTMLTPGALAAFIASGSPFREGVFTSIRLAHKE
jgi:hypothetical protein